MNAKFKLTSETKNWFGRTLFRIEALISFGSVEAGDKGGFVEKEENISPDGNAWVSGDARVFGDARVSGNALVSGDAQVFGNARVSVNARVSGDTRVYGDARVSGDARVYGNAWVSGNARVYGDARVSGNALVVKPITTATRSDGYTFALLPHKDGSFRITAGCRHFTFSEADAHWTWRDGTPLGDETRAILKFFRTAAAIPGIAHVAEDAA